MSQETDNPVESTAVPDTSAAVPEVTETVTSETPVSKTETSEPEPAPAEPALEATAPEATAPETTSAAAEEAPAEPTGNAPIAPPTTPVTREFLFNGATLADPDPSKTPDQIKKMFASNGYPTLTNASINGPTRRDGKDFYEFKAAVGTKG